MSAIPSLKLNTGATIPAIGLGVFAGWEQSERDAAKDWILTALKAGYRHLDTAWFYGTEKSVGEAIRESGVPREEIFVTTKLAVLHHARAEEAFKESLENLGLDYVDLYLIHWPQVFKYIPGASYLPKKDDGSYDIVEDWTFNDTWAEMEKIAATGKAKAIGVSNFSIKTLEQLFTTAKVVPAVNQVELHPYLSQPELVAYCKSKGIVVTAYTPSGYDAVRADPTIVEIAKKYNATPTQVILGWHVARGVTAVPCSKNPGRQLENINVRPTKLTEEDVARIDALNKNEYISNVADEKGEVYGWSLERLGW
ncbi:hypothetical protein PLICRDRAFT_111896 [Plicaturopsis crispa FD-325 SS-3]|nr:hypothetical protein PLICRDRAFT_111896 [Plicaturopsis crispa FD-325 SS-3]